MNLDQALAAIAGIDGEGFELGERPPAWPDFPITEYRRRYARLAALLDAEGFDALVLTQEEAVRYLSGYNSVIWAVGRWLPTVLVATRDPRRAALIASSFDAGCASGTAWVPTVDTYREAEEIPAKVRGHLAAAGAAAGRVGYEYGQGSFMAVPQHLAAALTGRAGRGHQFRPAGGPAGGGAGAGNASADALTPPRDAGRLISALRMLKSPLEIERIRRSVGAAVAGYQAGLQAATAGMTEKDLVAVIGSTMYRSGATAGTKPLFVNCVSGRTRYPLVDSPASDNVIAEGDIVFVDGGGACDGYVSDILRLIGVGRIRPEDRRYAEVAAGATEAMIDAVRPGVRVSQLLGAAAEHVAAAGVTDQVGEVAGHGIGLELWERPLIKAHDDPADDVAVQPGMVLCLEPILAPPHPDGGLAGIFVFEQQVLVTPGGCEVLSGAVPGRLWEVGI
ncbi:MAG TPA: Xaa-Pro peptidase family protein [Streptosporangiaceae bacterium]|jgi:Xaa-Pro aminopeptidase